MLLSQSVLLAVSPLVTDDADTVEAGKLQLNCDFQFVRTSSTSLYLVPINPVLGLTPRLELGAIFGYQWRDGSGSIPTTDDADDLTDLTIAPKLRLWQGLDIRENADRSSRASKRRIDSRVSLAACKYSRE